MPDNYLPENHPPVPTKTGVLLINLGTPDNYDQASVRRYLREFLSDRKVIELNPILWQIILHLFILPFRPKETALKYQKIWLKDHNESPLRYYTKAQALRLQEYVNKQNKDSYIVDFAMRYGNPSIENQIKSLLERGCNKILFIPLYPHYCAATSATVNDEIFRVLKKIRWQPNFRIVAPYHDNPVYIESLGLSLKKYMKDLNWTPDAILSSYHGIPQTYMDQGDPYTCFCKKTNRLFSEKLKELGVKTPSYMSFQSRFGPKEWVKPYTEDMILELISKGVKNLLVITPGFSADCIETIEEVDMEYRELFLKNGGENFALVPCLNDSDEGMKVITHLFECNRWIQPTKGYFENLKENIKNYFPRAANSEEV